MIFYNFILGLVLLHHLSFICKIMTYPKAVYFILLHQSLERFSYWGVSAILAIYLRDKLNFGDSSSTAVYHTYALVHYFCCIAGAIIADSYFGKFVTIIGFSILYVAGTLLISLAGATIFPTDSRVWITMIGLLSTAVAAGSIKPCITAFGADQFKLPEQEGQLKSYFPLLFLIINASVFISTLVIPILRRDVSCFGETDCYPAAFGLLCGFSFLAAVIFIAGKTFYTFADVETNVALKVLLCVQTALKIKFTKKVDISKLHWLDYAEGKYSADFIERAKQALSVLIMFLPVTIFYAVYDQQFSRWAFQAGRMNGNFFSYEVPPDQVAALNSLLTFLCIPLFEKIVYPLLSRCHIFIKPMSRALFGFVCATLAFLTCAILEIFIENGTHKEIHMAWLLPQYTFMSVAEVCLIPSLNQYAYSQAHVSMKSLLMMAAILPQAFGNLIVVIVAEAKMFQKQSQEFFFFTGIILLATVLMKFFIYRFERKNETVTGKACETENEVNVAVILCENRSTNVDDAYLKN